MKTKKKTLVGLMCIVLTSCFITNTLFAWMPIPGDYKLIGGVCNREFNIIGQSVTYNGTTVDYASSIRTAVSNWNSAVNWSYTNPADVLFAESISSTGSEIKFNAGNYGNNGYYGYTFYLDSNNNALNSYGNFPEENYASCSIQLNVYLLQASTPIIRTNIAAHEMGHALGLNHSDISSALMDKNIAFVTNLRLPQSDDITGIQTLYR